MFDKEQEQYGNRLRKHLESGRDIKCLDCEGKGIINVKVLYSCIKLGYGTEVVSGKRLGSEEEIECHRCKGTGQFNLEKDKLTQEIKALLVKGE